MGVTAVRDAGRARVSRRNPLCVLAARSRACWEGGRKRAADAHENRPRPGRRRRASAPSTILSHRGMRSAIPHKWGLCAEAQRWRRGHAAPGLNASAPRVASVVASNDSVDRRSSSAVRSGNGPRRRMAGAHCASVNGTIPARAARGCRRMAGRRDARRTPAGSTRSRTGTTWR